MRGDNPPRFPERLLRYLLPDPHGEEVVDELAHEYRKGLEAGMTRLWGRLWYWGQILAPDTLRLVFLLRSRKRRNPTLPDRRPYGTKQGETTMSLESVVQDARYALRSLRRSPGFTLLVLLTLGLGIGANTAIFSVVNGVVLKPLPFPDAHGLIRIAEVDPDFRAWGFSPPNFVDLREETTVLQHVAAYLSTSFTLTGSGTPEQVSGFLVSSGFFELLGLPPVLGRSFLREEELAGSGPVAILSHGAWERRFGSDQDILGTPLLLDGVPHTVVGVSAPRLRLGSSDPEVWVPIGFSERDLALRGRHFLTGLGRLRPDVDIEAAQEAMNAMWAGMGDEYSETNGGWRVRATPLMDAVIGTARTPLLLLLGAAGLVLLIACANVANLTLARAEGREREFAIRSAIGGSKGRVLRQQFFEHLVLGLGGGILGLASAYLAIDNLLALFGTQLPRADQVTVGGPVLLFTLGASVAVALLTSLAPLMKGSWRDLSGAFRDIRPRGGVRVARGRVRGTFVVAEVALSLVLVAGTGLLLNSFMRLMQVDLGFQTENLLTGEIFLPEARYRTTEETSLFFQTLCETLERRGEVRSAGAVGFLPLTLSYNHDFSGVGELAEVGWSAEDRQVTPGYFRAMGIPILAGRELKATDDADAPGVAILNETLARRVFPNESAVGKRVKLTGFPDEESWEVVGVAGDTRLFGARENPTLTLYRPHSQFHPSSFMSIVVRASGPPEELANTLREVVASMDPELPVSRISTMEAILSDSMTSDRVLLLLVGLFGCIAVVLGAVGIFGVMSYTVSLRTREIGVRMAVGGAPPEVLRMVVMQGMRLVGLGICLGLLGSIFVGRALSGVLFGVRPTDPATLAAVVGLITLVSLAACFFPAQRAAAVDPAVSLREE